MIAQPDLFDDLERDEALAETWTGAPLTYTADYYTPDELHAALDRWAVENGRFGIYPFSHMWHPDRAIGSMQMLSADARFEGWHWPDCSRPHSHEGLPNEYMHQANCPDCRWHFISANSALVRDAATEHIEVVHEAIA